MPDSIPPAAAPAATSPLPSALPFADEEEAIAAATPAKEKWKPSLQELDRGFGIEEEEEEDAYGGIEIDEEVVAQVDKGVNEASETLQGELDSAEHSDVDELEEEENVEDRETKEEKEERDAPSRRTSMMSSKTDRTGVASQSDGFEGLEDEVEELVSDAESPQKLPLDEASTRSSNDTNPSLGQELSRALSDLGSISVVPHPLTSSPSLPVLPTLPAIEIHGDETQGAGYDASDDSDWDEEVEKEELSQSDYSNPSDEENARRRALTRVRSSQALRRDAASPVPHRRQFSDELDLPIAKYASERSFGTGKVSSLAVDPDVLFQAPSDVDLTDVRARRPRRSQAQLRVPALFSRQLSRQNSTAT
jgi:hypothetical protein